MTNPKMGRPVKNKFKVPQKQWNKWSNHAKTMFNKLYTNMIGRNQSLFLHTQQPAIPREHWQVTCWNAAWIAAGIADGGAPRYLGKAKNVGKKAKRRATRK